MKTNNLYKLNKNLDLKNENFLVKKGTLVTVSTKYNETDETIPTVVSLKFGNIIGEYQFEEVELNKHLENKVFKLLAPPLFKIGDSVKVPDFGSLCGIINEIKQDALKGHRYVVVFSGKRYTILESRLSSCP